jgi:hypothetical protein
MQRSLEARKPGLQGQLALNGLATAIAGKCTVGFAGVFVKADIFRPVRVTPSPDQSTEQPLLRSVPTDLTATPQSHQCPAAGRPASVSHAADASCRPTSPLVFA